MNPLTNILSASQVLLDLDASSKKRVFEQAGMLFESHLGLARSVVFDSLFAREKLGSTGLGQGIAIPHGRIKGLKHTAGAFLRLATPVRQLLRLPVTSSRFAWLPYPSPRRSIRTWRRTITPLPRSSRCSLA